jgi:hypothetical protein
LDQDTELASPDSASIEKAAAHTLEVFLDDLYDPDQFRIDGDWDEETRALRVHVDARDNLEVNEAILELFFDLFFDLPMSIEQRSIYTLRWVSFRDRALTQKVHEYHLQTDIRLLPETGGVSRAEWEAFIEGLTFTKDGAPQELPAPDDFLDDEG